VNKNKVIFEEYWDKLGVKEVFLQINKQIAEQFGFNVENTEIFMNIYNQTGCIFTKGYNI
jgi:hypothetical protein